jgi:SAM-dependent methyltransferase
MSVFGNYARYYDLLYRDKDYAGEAEFIDRSIRTHNPNARDVLELGCGTGHHAILLAKLGYQIHGVDLSLEMLHQAKERQSLLPPDLAAKLHFSRGDLRSIRLERNFDVVIALFHVISYQTTTADLQAAFATAKQHLRPGGILIFDVWYGAAVLSERPSVRVKRWEDAALCVTRIAEPIVYPNENLVEVNYHVFVRDKIDNSVAEIHESHRMRYLFRPELELLLDRAGFQIGACREWMSDREIGFDTWGIYLVARKC